MKHFFSLLSLLLSLSIFTGGISAAAYEIPEAISVVSEAPVPIAAEQPLSAAKPSKKSNALPVIDIDNETILEYKTIDPKFLKNRGSKMPYLYNFNTDMSSGIDSDGNLINTEALYGLTAYVKDRNIVIKAYNYTDTKLTVKASAIYNLDKNNGNMTKAKIDYNYKTVNTKNFVNGLYRFVAKFSNSVYVDLCFYVNGEETWLCNTQFLTKETAKLYKDRRTALAKIIKNGKITPKNSLDISGIYYPCYEFDDTYRCDTQRWAELSDTFIESDWSDEHKLFVIWEWINENIAYDHYVSDTLGCSRALYNNNYYGKYSVYNTRTGVCFDYAHIFLIMCRAQGIPAITIGSLTKEHVWNAAYINNRWIEFELTASCKYEVYTKDTTLQTQNITDHSLIPYSIIPCYINGNDEFMPSDATANEYLQTGYYIY